QTDESSYLPVGLRIVELGAHGPAPCLERGHRIRRKLLPLFGISGGTPTFDRQEELVDALRVTCLRRGLVRSRLQPGFVFDSAARVHGAASADEGIAAF